MAQGVFLADETSRNRPLSGHISISGEEEDEEDDAGSLEEKGRRGRKIEERFLSLG